MQKQVSYTSIVQHISDCGAIVSPRGEKTKELLNASMAFNSIPVIHRTGMSFSLAMLEATMLIAGYFDIDCIARVAPNANLALYAHQSDYGPRVRNQIFDVIDRLIEDPSSRRAVIYFNDRDTQQYDLACTTSIQFLSRDGRLNALVSMRSWDIVFGMPMDIIMFGVLQSLIAQVLRCDVGDLIVNASSLHLYNKTRSKGYEDGAMSRMIIDNDYVGQSWYDVSNAAQFAIDNLRNGENFTFPFSYSMIDYGDTIRFTTQMEN